MLGGGVKISDWMNGESLMRRNLGKAWRKKGATCNAVRVTIVALTYWLFFNVYFQICITGQFRKAHRLPCDDSGHRFDTNYLKWGQTSQVKGTVLCNTAGTSDTSCKFCNLQATLTSDKLTTNSGVFITPVMF